MKYRRGKRPMSEINVVPYIDVMLVLLVIFMVTTPLLSQGVDVKLPQAAAKPLTSNTQDPIIVSVNAKGNYFLNIADNPDVPIAPQQLATRVAAQLQLDRQQGKSQSVLVKGDQDVNYGKVVTAMVLLQRAGAEGVGLMTQTPPGEDIS